ncbi:MAG: chemotaxis protein CheW [Myxococcales bacterium]|nr:chemotaxis protein CheW [Myxococcales bacterium]
MPSDEASQPPAVPEDATAARVELQVLPVFVAGGWMAFEAAIVSEVTGEAKVTPIPSNTPGIVGIMTWRSRVVAVLDLELIASGSTDPETQTESAPRTVIATLGADTIALRVQSVREVAWIDALRPAHVARFAFAPQEVVVDAEAMPLFEPQRWLEALEANTR